MLEVHERQAETRKNIEEMIKEDSQEQIQVAKVKERLEFEEQRGDKDIYYWIKYNRRFGNSHLINPTHRRSYRVVYDLDIKAAILIILFVLIYSFVRFVIKFCKCKFKSKSGREEHTESET